MLCKLTSAVDFQLMKSIGLFKNTSYASLPVKHILPRIDSAIDDVAPHIKHMIFQYVKNRNFDPFFWYCCAENGITDVAELIRGPGIYRINLHENFCGLFWTLCYFVLYTYDELYAKKLNTKGFSGQIAFTTQNDYDAYNIWQYGKKLRIANPFIQSLPSPWPGNLPGPLTNTQNCLNANGLFTYGITFLLFHELGHLFYNHSFRKMQRYTKEVQADNFAINTAANAVNKSVQGTINNGAILAFISFCMLDPNTGAGTGYPFTEDRITNALKQMNLLPTDITWMIAAYGLIIWLADIRKITWPNPGTYNTPRDYYYLVLKICKVILGHP